MTTNEERTRRWRLILGAESTSQKSDFSLSSEDAGMDAALAALYGGGERGDE